MDLQRESLQIVLQYFNLFLKKSIFDVGDCMVIEYLPPSGGTYTAKIYLFDIYCTLSDRSFMWDFSHEKLKILTQHSELYLLLLTFATFFV